MQLCLGLVLALAVAGAGCGSGGAASCSVVLPADCPTVAPSYANDVAPIIKAVCADCHSPGTTNCTGMVAGTIPLNNYPQVYARRTTMLDQVYRCLMPPACAPPATAAQTNTILTWLVCKAPNN